MNRTILQQSTIKTSTGDNDSSSKKRVTPSERGREGEEAMPPTLVDRETQKETPNANRSGCRPCRTKPPNPGGEFGAEMMDLMNECRATILLLTSGDGSRQPAVRESPRCVLPLPPHYPYSPSGVLCETIPQAPATMTQPGTTEATTGVLKKPSRRRRRPGPVLRMMIIDHVRRKVGTARGPATGLVESGETCHAP
jgi:hypothetical protein